MSSQEKNDLFEEKEKTVVISGEDVKNVRDFFTHFKVNMPDYLNEALSAFEAEKTWVNQELVKVNLCKAMMEADHPLFKDELFNQVMENSSKIVWDAQFNRSLEKTLTVEESNK